MVRISCPRSSRWVANEWRKVWQSAGLVSPALSTAFFTAFWTMLGSKWWRPSFLMTSFQRFRWGNTHCQLHSRSAWRIFFASAWGRITAPHPAVRACGRRRGTSLEILFQHLALASGRQGGRSLPPLPFLTFSSLRLRSRSCTLKQIHENPPAPREYFSVIAGLS